LAASRRLRRADNRDRSISGVRLCEKEADLKGNDLQTHQLHAEVITVRIPRHFYPALSLSHRARDR
jgi:hypothetical protein